MRSGREGRFIEPVPYQDQLLLSFHDIKIMDLHQENLAKQLGDKNRLVRGVAGSGKTLILASRAKLLTKEHPDWKVLVLCYNISLAQNIKNMVDHMMNGPESLFDFDFGNEEAGQNAKVHHITVRNFHAWLKHGLKISEYQIPDIIQKLENNEAILPKYDAILIDEGQDFASDWLKLVGLLLNPETKSLLLVEDRAQNIYKRKRSYVQDTGLDFRGRSKILNINYRNTSQIVKFAWDFYESHSILKNKVVKREAEGVEIISPLSTRRKGPEPVLYYANNFKEEMAKIAQIITFLHHKKNVPYSEILILYRVKRTHKLQVMDIIEYTLKGANFPYYWITKNEHSKRQFDREEETIKISTIDSSKGLDFQAVFIVNADNMPFALEEDKEREASLLYIGMTRAKEYLTISYSGISEYTEYFEEIRKGRLSI
ncbi:DEAD/DEAH box helicase [Bacillus taeanensis]|uniref:DEAD/DEAH box helicase n=1 Tax=Bacillus taeanensis TaxID=273032 RepID=UPI0026B704A2